ncbi:MAG TPA: tripartite tricarboxylate transporter TctB family protein [Burkholderiales bacterium]|nr:tripartite tricarboxylate transporter TctB family protein [Burkholderiales bacterium]
MRLRADKGELGLALFFAAVGGLWIFRAARMPLWEGFAPDSGFLPLIYGLLLTALALAAAGQVLSAGETGPTQEFRKPLLVLAVLIATVSALPFAGFILSVFALLFLLYAVVERLPWLNAALVSAATTGVLYLIFKVWLGVPLP